MATSQRSWELSGTGSTTLTYKIDGVTVATLKGVSNGITINAGQITDGSISVDGDTNVIKLNEDALGDASVTLTNAKGQSFELALASSVKGVTSLGAKMSSDKAKGTAKIEGDMSKGYALTSKTKITYTAAAPKNLATISGLKKDTDGGEYSEEEVLFDSTNNKIKLYEDALGSTDITLTNSNGGEYQLAMVGEDGKEITRNGLGLSEYKWTGSGGTVAYKAAREEGWALATNGLKITHTAANDAVTIATIKGLNSTVKADDGEVAGITVTNPGVTERPDGTETSFSFELSKSVLATSKGSATITAGTGYTGELTLGTDVPRETRTENVWTFSKGTGTYKTASIAYYTLNDGKSVTCTPQVDAATLATVKGLKTSVTSEDIVVNPNTHVITLGSGAVGTSTLSVTMPKGATTNYTLALDEEDEEIPTFSVSDEGGWTVNATKGTAVYSSVVTGGFIPSSDGGNTIVYRAPANKTSAAENLVTISGLKKISKATEAQLGAITGAIDIDEETDSNNRTITLGSDALGTSNVTVKATGSGVTYTLAIDRESVYDDTDTEVENGINVWRVSGTTATYKKVIPAYYSYDETKNSIVYHKEADVETYAVVKGIKSGLEVSEDGSSIGKYDADSGDYSSLISFAEGKDKVITFEKDALGTTNVTFDTKKTVAGYTFALAEENAGEWAPQLNNENANLKWSVSGKTTTTATLKGNMDSGYTLASDGSSITYTAAKTGSKAATLATITGLAKGIKATNLNASEGAPISVGKDGKVTLSASLLSDSDVAIASSFNYSLALDNAVPDAKVASYNVWNFNNVTGEATYDEFKPEHYVIDKTGSKIDYVKGTETKTLASVIGLNPNMTVNSDRSAIGVQTKDKDADGNYIFNKYVTIDGKEITVTKGALNQEDVELGGSGYTLVAGTDVKEAGKAEKFVIDGTTAKLWVGTTEGYEAYSNNNGLKYTAASDGSIVAEIKGIKSGLTAATKEDGDNNIVAYIGTNATRTNPDTNKKEDYVTEGLYTGTKTNPKGSSTLEKQPVVILTKEVLDEHDVTIETKDSKSDKYQLELASDVPQAASGKTSWKVNGNSVSLVPYSTECWTEKPTTSGSGNNKISDLVYTVTYSVAKKGEAIATITGLNSKALTLDNNGQIAGLSAEGVKVDTEVDAKDGKTKVTAASGTITLSNSVLNKSDVTIVMDIENAGESDSTPPIALKLGADVTSLSTKTVNGDGGTGVLSGTTFTYKETIKAGYAEDENETGNIVYRAGSTDTTTITYVTVKPEAAYNHETGLFEFKIAPSDVAKNNKGVYQTVKLTTSGKYNKNYVLALDESANPPTYEFIKAANATKATYNTVNTGCVLSDDKKSIVYADADNAKVTAIATISGLAKDVLIDGAGNVITPKLDDYGEIVTDADGNTVYDIVTKNAISVDTDENGDEIITLDKSVLGSNDITLGKNDNYSLYIDPVACAVDTVSAHVVNGKGTATIKEGQTEGWTLSTPKKITHIKDNLTTLATISGLAKTAVIPESTFNASTKVITLGADELKGSKKVTIADNKGTGYTLNILQTPDVVPTEYEQPRWTFSKGKATLQNGTSDGWALTNSKTITYQTAKLTAVATVSGLPKDLVSDGNGNLYLKPESDAFLADSDEDEAQYGEQVLTITPAEYNSNGVVTKTGVIKISSELLEAGSDALVKEGRTVVETGVKKLTLGAKDNYVFEFDTNDPPSDPVVSTPTAVATGKGTVELQSDITAGYTLTDKAITYVPAEEDKTIAKITGLTSEITQEKGIPTDAIKFDSEKKTITLTAAALTGVTKKVSLTSDEYTLALDDGLAPTTLREPKWTVKGTTATLKEGTSAGYKVATNGKSVTYSAETAEGTLATITGLRKNLKVNSDGKIDGISVYKNLKTIAVNADALGTTDVKLNADSEYTFDSEDIKAPFYSEPSWTVSKGTATLKQNITAGFELADDGKTLKYTAAKSGVTLVTITGLNTSYDYNSNPSALEYNATTGVITVGANALGTKKVAIKEKNSPYTLELGDDVNTSKETVTKWVTSGTTATFKTYDKAYYNLDKNTGAIVYTAESKPTNTWVTVSGLKKDAEITNVSADKVITLTSSQVGTSTITLKDGEDKGYTLALKGSVPVTRQENGEWGDVAGGAVTLKGTLTAGFTLAANGKSATYSKEKKNQTFAKISGIKAFSEEGCVEGNVITLGEDQLSNKAVTLTNSNGSTFKLALDDDIEASTIIATDGEKDVSPEWSVSKTVATLKGVVSEGYKVTSDTSISYTKETARNSKTGAYTPQELAKVSGIVSGKELDTVSATDSTINLKNEQLSSKVSVSGAGYHDFYFASDYSNATIYGSSSADSITVGGTNITVNTAKGNDYVDFNASDSGNTFLYATGDGNDVIADFTVGKDRIKITSGKTITLTKDGDDAVINVDKGSITLKGQANSSIYYYDKNDVVKPLTASADLLESDNFIAEGYELSSLTGSDAYALDDFNATQPLTNNDLTTLTKQSSLISYGDKDK